MNSEPLLSIVVVSRNDDHGGNLLYRMQLFASSFLEQAKRHNLSSELIIVEWNPLPDRPRLAEALQWPEDTGPCVVRIIEVPPEIHSRFRYSDGLPLFQMIGKNAGIRRARGRFVLATNIDILFSDELIRFFSSGQLKMEHMYRIDRYDVPFEIPQGVSIEEQLAYCQQNIIRINTRKGTQILGEGDDVAKLSISRYDILKKRIRANYSSFKEMVRTMHNLGDAARIMKAALLYAYQFVAPYLYRLRGKPLHTNACGDFTLMANEHWLAVRGYPEYEMYSLYLDGLLCYAAHYNGAREIILRDPMRIYHIEHAPGSGWAPGIGAKLLNDRLKTAGIPHLEYEKYTSMVRQMLITHKAIITNDEDWGLINAILPETLITTGGI